MTVIVWDGSQLAADHGATYGYVKSGRTVKIERLRDGSLLGAAGNASKVAEMEFWLKAGGDPSKFRDEWREDDRTATLLHILKDGTIHQYETGPHPIVFTGTRHAIGSGNEAALAAMIMGADAAGAVQVACQVCNGCDLDGQPTILELAPLEVE